MYRVYPEVEDGRGTFDLACAFAVLFGVWKPGSVLLTAEVVWSFLACRELVLVGFLEAVFLESL